jgi:hypothetical protein
VLVERNDMTTKAEKIASQCLRAVLAPMTIGATIKDSDDFSTFQCAMGFFIPGLLRMKYVWWEKESLDGFRFVVARKTAHEEAEFLGLGILITDQTWTPIHIRLRLSRQSDKFEWIGCSIGELGDGKGKMKSIPYESDEVTKLLHSMESRLEGIVWTYSVARETSSKQPFILGEI